MTSEIVDPFGDDACAACGASLVADAEPDRESLFYASRLRRRCPRCGEPLDPSSRAAVVRGVFTGDEQEVAGGATFRFALVVDCGKCFPETTFGAHLELQALLETEPGTPFRSLVDAY